jgi:hypothetical protein
MRRGLHGLAGALLLAFSLGVSSASAVTPGPSFRITSIAEPTNFQVLDNTMCESAACDGYYIEVTNSGGQATDGSPITVTDTLPSGLTGQTIFGSIAPSIYNDVGEGAGAECEVEPVVECTFSGFSLPPDGILEIHVYTVVSPLLAGSITNSVEVTGGGLAVPVVSSAQNQVSTTLPAPGLDEFNLDVNGIDGGQDSEAGDHPFGVTAMFNFSNDLIHGEKPGKYSQRLNTHAIYIAPGTAKDLVVDLPPGFVGDPQDAAQCTELELATEATDAGTTECPPSSIIGQIQLNAEGTLHASAQGPGTSAVSPVYNMVPEQGYPAEFGFNVFGTTVNLYATAVPSSSGYVLRVSSPSIPHVFLFNNIALTFWGAPEDPGHTQLRFNNKEEGVETGLPDIAFLTNPVDCSAGPLTATAMSDTWEHPGRWTAEGSPDLSDPAWHVIKSVVYPSMTGCNMLQFNPSIETLPSTTQADEPTGLSVNLRVPQASQQIGNLATPEMRNVTISLPPGVSLAPGAADGLQACTAAEIALESALAGSCPNASVVGTVRVITPLLAKSLEGHIFLGQPQCSPCSKADAADGNLFRLYLEIAGSGIVVKQPGTVYVNPATGQITAKFENNPQLPFTELQANFKGGLRAPLATPQSCGTFTTTSDFTPWSAPVTPDSTPLSSFNVDWDGNGGACPGVLPFSPSFSAGTVNPNAGQFSPLTLTFGREDREQDLSAISVHMPPGLLGSLSGVPLCGEPQAALGTCGEGSRIGSLTVAAGPGGHPYYEKGTIYLTGPYKGAPFGLSIAVPTIAGPFNLGTVVVRAKINIDPITTALTVTSDPLPQIIDGIPLRLRVSNVTIDRPGFTFNPTSCAQLQITATISGSQGAQAHVQAPFAVAGCAGLTFHPTLMASTSAHTSRVDGASLDVRVGYPSGPQSNISTVKVELPKGLPSRLTTLQKACTAATFEANPASCPAASIVGVVRARTPILPVQLTGPAYFVSHGGAAYPDLIMILQGYGVRVDLIGSTFISKAGITSATFKTIPDVPVTSFELFLPEGPDSALTTNGNLCKQSLVMPTTFTAQDGAVIKQNTKIAVNGCPRKVRASKASRARASRRAREAAEAKQTGKAHKRGRG